MNAKEAKEIVDSLTENNTIEYAAIKEKIAAAVYNKQYYYDCLPEEILSPKTCIDLQAEGFLIITSQNEMRISWE